MTLKGKGSAGIKKLGECLSVASKYTTDYTSHMVSRIYADSQELSDEEFTELIRTEHNLPGFTLVKRGTEPNAMVWKTDGYKDVAEYLRMVNNAHQRVNDNLLNEFVDILKKYSAEFSDDRYDFGCVQLEQSAVSGGVSYVMMELLADQETATHQDNLSEEVLFF